MEAKTRRLKKYEAETTPWAVDQVDPTLDLYSPFGPMIGKLSLPDALVDRINSYADRLISPDKSTELLLPSEFVAEGGDESLARHAARLVTRYLAGVENSRVSKVEFEVFWVVSQYAGTTSPVHFHSGDIAGVLYLKVPEIDEAEEARSYITGRQAGYINFLIGGKQRFSKSLVSFKPKVGDFYVFPGWLLHVAEPFIGAGERRSLSFNAVVSVEDP